MRPLLLFCVLLTACAPVRDDNGDLPYCEDDDYEPSNSQDDAASMQDGGLFDLVLCPTNDDWLYGRLESYGYVEVYVSWPAAEHTGVIELWRDDVLVGSTDQNPQQQVWFNSWDTGDYYVKGTQERGNEAESVQLQVYIEENVVIGR